jgi:hypothetical protein
MMLAMLKKKLMHREGFDLPTCTPLRRSEEEKFFFCPPK